jgi:hypothetical protein
VRLAERLIPERAILLETSPPDLTQARFGWGRPPNATLQAMILRHKNRYCEVLDRVGAYGPDLCGIPRQATSPTEPYWDQHWWTGVDAATLYAFIRDRSPKRYHEIGSGNSTLFAARALRDGGLSTQILSVDPHPRTEIDALCARVIRHKLQEANILEVANLESGDILLIDASHYALMSSDATVLFLDLLPILPSGVLVGIHDIFLPDDYPWWLRDRWYSEQYLLAAWLIGAGDRAKIKFAAHFATTYPELRALVDATWSKAGLTTLAYGSAFWIET